MQTKTEKRGAREPYANYGFFYDEQELYRGKLDVSVCERERERKPNETAYPSERGI